MSYLERCIRYCTGFAEQNAPQSMTRLVTLLCALGGVTCALAALIVAMRPHLTEAHASVIKGLAMLSGTFIAGGVVALVNRTRATPPTEKDGTP